MTTICKRFIVSGRVQGVFYRDSTRKKARELNLVGWVKNRETGEVEVLACGEAPALEALKNWLWEGPPAASVADVKEEQLEGKTCVDFQVL